MKMTRSRMMAGLGAAVLLCAAIMVAHSRQAALTPVRIEELSVLAGAAHDVNAQALLEAEAERGVEHAQFVLGRLLLARTAAADVQEGMQWLARLADHGHEPRWQGQALAELGKVYLRGNLVQTPDSTQAAQRFRAGVALDNGACAYYLGVMYKNGQGVTRSSTEAAKLLHQAADKGIPQAMFLLANLYLSGDGVARDETRVRYWLEKAAELEYPEAVQMVAMGWHEGSMGFERDDEKANMAMMDIAHAMTERPVEP